MCKIVGREGTASLVVIAALVSKISQENQRGGGARNSPPPSGARVNVVNVIAHSYLKSRSVVPQTDGGPLHSHTNISKDHL